MDKLKITVYGNPTTKKNSNQIVINNGKRIVIPSKKYLDYKNIFLPQLTGKHKLGIDYACNVKCVYYRDSRRRVDLNNLLSATSDLLVDGGVLKDDNFKIIGSYDGSRVKFDKKNPRVEIEITDFVE